MMGSQHAAQGHPVADPPVFERLAILGLGLIGGSVARAVRQAGLAKVCVGFDRDEAVRQRVRELGFVDRVADTAVLAVAQADCVVLAIPVGACAPAMGEIADHLSPGAILTDVGSVKGCVVRDVGPLVPPGVHFIPGHPIAGTEFSGPDAGFAALFDGRYCVLTPPGAADPAALAKLTTFWERMGSVVEVMSADHHDKVLAITSHLPHLIAYTIVGTAAELEEDIKHEVIRFSASGFRDFTRIAASDPVMWRDVFLNNKDATLEIIQRFTEDLTALQKAIRRGDGAQLQDWFTKTRGLRRSIIEARQA